MKFSLVTKITVQIQGCTHTPEIWETPQNSRYQKGDTCQFNAEDTQILGATLQNFVTTVTWHPGFVYPCTNLRFSN